MVSLTLNQLPNRHHRRQWRTESAHSHPSPTSWALPTPDLPPASTLPPRRHTLLSLMVRACPARATGSAANLSSAAFQHSSYFRDHSRTDSGLAKSRQPPHRGLPPTPPMSTDASFGNRSPTSKSVSHAPAGPTGYYYETTPPLEADQHQRQPPSAEPARRASYPHQALPPTLYLEQPPSGTYYQNVPPPAQPQAPGLYYQRPLPNAFPPPPMPVPVAMNPASGPWQHHHYLSPSHGGAFPQSQDRYICQTCNKAFSRPSSLRIHSHSHTGEKPFKCPHSGCGKAFSVRSNMKRHERGCHSFEVNAGMP